MDTKQDETHLQAESTPASPQIPTIPASSQEGTSLSANQTKRNELRAKAKRIRSEMPAPYRAHKSAEICKQLEQALTFTLGLTNTSPAACTIGVYAAFPEEVDLDDFIQYAYNLGCRIAFPCMVRDAHGIDDAPHRLPKNIAHHTTQQTMEMRVVMADQYRSKQVPFLNHPLKRYTHNHEDLNAYPYVAADELTMLVVPVVGFDTHGNRLGYGAGNYDRYLTQVPKECRIVGVAFAEQAVDDIPTEDHDVALAIISL
ncbi:MAG: 5-formyltetrahydrofolate cyclo-ligase [Eggerthellaceae bacterium]